MKYKTILISAVLTVMIIASVSVAVTSETSASAKQLVQIYIPRSISFGPGRITVGDICIVRGNKLMAEKLEAIVLGKITAAGQKFVIDKKTIQARIACSGFDVNQIKLTGASKVSVQGSKDVVRAEVITSAAAEFLKTQLKKSKNSHVCQVLPLKNIRDITFAREFSGDLKYNCAVVRKQSDNMVGVMVTVTEDGSEIAKAEVDFRLKFVAERALAIGLIKAGEVITPEKVRIENTVSDHPAKMDESIYGLIAKQNIAAGRIVKNTMLSRAEQQVLVKRNDNVLVRIDKYGFVLTTLAKAMEQGRIGQMIRVRNIDSNRIITVRINKDGTASPVF